MSRKSLILCLAVLAVMVLGTGVAVAFLYSGTDGGNKDKTEQVASQDRYLLLPAVPSDAILAGCFSEAGEACRNYLSGFPFIKGLSDKMEEGQLAGLAGSHMAVSLHYSGALLPLYVFETGRPDRETGAMPETAAALLDYLSAEGYVAEYVDCTSLEGASGLLSKTTAVVASKSDALVKSSLRHLRQGISLMDANGFVSTSSRVAGNDVIFFSNAYSSKLLPSFLEKAYSRKHAFVADFADWTAAGIGRTSGGPLMLTGAVLCEDGAENFMAVLENTVPSKPSAAEALPSYTIAATTFPIKEIQSYVSAYKEYKDSKQSLQMYLNRQKELQKKTGISPSEFMRRLDIQEVATASFLVAGKIEKVNLLKPGSMDIGLVFKGTDITSMKGYSPDVHAWPYASFAASVFGALFDLPDESCFTYINGWLVSGSLAGVQEYVDDKALEYSLQDYMTDSGQPGLLSREPVAVLSYISLTEASRPSVSMFRPEFIAAMSPFAEGCDNASLLFSVSTGKKGTSMNAGIYRLEPQRTKAPAFERDTTVVVPEGPFTVRNSGTGKDNLFYQNSHLSLCLQEDGKDLWGIPFKKPLCGKATTVDYFANGKLQIIFGAGSQVYLIDRLGRYVNGFPIELGKEILVGPDVYDFSGSRKYNIMVLHKDNTIEMYNLRGQKPASWKTITAKETIKALPERIEVGGSSFWVVRTSIQTLIFPFYGGQPLTTFEGDSMIRPDSDVTPVDAANVEVASYDGKRRTVKVK